MRSPKKINYKRFGSFTIVLLALFSLTQASAAELVPHYSDGMNLFPNKDDQELYEPSPRFDRDVSPPLYRYEDIWGVYIKTENQPESFKGTFKGNMGFLRPTNETQNGLGRTFAHKSTLYRWGVAFNGNPSYVEKNTKSVKLTRRADKESFVRYHSIEIGRASGAYVTQKLDKGENYIEVITTPFPKGSISAPNEVDANKQFYVTINAEEFNPFGEQIKYEIYEGNNKVLKSGVKFVNNLSNFKVPVSMSETGRKVLTLKVSDSIERTSSFSTIVNVKESNEPPLPPKDGTVNIPPVASVFVESQFYWVEEAKFQNNSYDADGEIVFSELTVDGEPSEYNKKFPRVTEPEEHEVSIRVVDDYGDSDSDSKSFKILPTTPIAEFSITGTTKVNRKISLDGTLSDKTSPVHVAPIDYSLTEWTIKPLTEGVAQQDILIQNSSDRSKRDFLVREPGDYEVTLTVTNNYGETSEPVTKTITVEPDQPPIAKFTVDSAKAIRDKNGEKNAVITLKDSSISPDEDIIKQRIYYVEYDSNNDGFFGTPLDEPKEIISNGNETTVQFKSNKVGNYRFSLELVEDFGQETIPEFIQEEHYLRDSSGVIDQSGNVSVYQDPAYFNLPEYDKSVEIINVNPVIDFGVRRQNKIDVVLNFAGMDTATQQYKTGARPGAGINNGGGGGYYDHYYYTIDETEKNQLSAFASTLESNLLAKGIDAKVTIDNAYEHQEDEDGEGVRDIPYWDWRDYGSYSYSSYSGTSPYSGDWEVVSTSTSPIMAVTNCVGKPPGCKDCSTVSHPPPCDYASNEVWGQVGTNYNSSLRKYFSDYRFVVTRYENQGVNSTETVNTTDFTEAYANHSYRTAAQKLYLRMDKRPWDWMNNSSKVDLVTNKTKSNNIFFWNMAVSSNRTNAERLINGGLGIGQFSIHDAQNLNRNVKDVENYIINKYFMDEDGVNTTIVLGDKLDYTVNYSDHENDPELKREWKFTHDPTKINGREIDNAPAKPIPQSGLYIDSPLQLTEVGTYRVQLRAQDDPVYDGDERFFNYRKWSDEEVQREYIINVHRRPIADFTFEIDPGTLDLTLDPSISYDPDHQFNRSDKGIVEQEWVNYSVDGKTYQGAPPSRLTVNKDYDVTLQVKDIDGAYGVVTKRISTHGYNIKPVALFDAPEMVINTMDLNIIDRSYDPNGDPLTDYKITVRRQGESTVIKSLDGFPKSFEEMGLGAGNYILSLTVKDIPRVPPSLTSDPYEKTIKVIENRPPVSNFKLTPDPLLVNEVNNYQDLSSDPDGHPLKNYSWTIELLDDDEVIKTWNTGVAPTDWSEYGTGRFRVTQTVFDDPPYPLPSLSGEHSEVVRVVLGPQRPYALFDYTPKPAIQGDNIKLDPGRSFDPDGTITAWEWTIKAPNGTMTSSSSEYPVINNAVVGTYEVTLYVRDNDNLRSRVPSIQNIVVSPKPPNKPPVALFDWEPFKPFLGDNITLNPDRTYDLDGTIVSYQWQIRSKEGSITSSSSRYPSLPAASGYYDVSLTVRDNQGASASATERINVNIAKLVPLVTHNEKWKQYWVSEGFNENINSFMAGEQFIIRLTTTPANRVEGKVHFGAQIGEVNIPSSAFTLVSTSTYEYVWETTLWREDFEKIPKGQYAFEFTGYHPANSPYVESSGIYLIDIVGNVYDAQNYHRNY